MCDKIETYQEKEEFEIEDGVLKKYNGNKKEIIIPDGVTVIGKEAFFLSEARKIVMPDSVKRLDEYAFDGLVCLRVIKMSRGLEEIGENAFCNCRNLGSIKIPNGVKTIGKWAFKGCQKIKYLSVPRSVTSLGIIPLYDEELFTSLRQEDVVKIKRMLFMSACIELKKIRLPKHLEGSVRSTEFCQVILY